jgi:hypothetical protein
VARPDGTAEGDEREADECGHDRTAERECRPQEAERTGRGEVERGHDDEREGDEDDAVPSTLRTGDAERETADDGEREQRRPRGVAESVQGVAEAADDGRERDGCDHSEEEAADGRRCRQFCREATAGGSHAADGECGDAASDQRWCVAGAEQLDVAEQGMCDGEEAESDNGEGTAVDGRWVAETLDESAERGQATDEEEARSDEETDGVRDERRTDGVNDGQRGDVRRCMPHARQETGIRLRGARRARKRTGF